jgi:hypothetical protein
MIAAMRKLLAAVWSVAKHRQPLVPRVPKGRWISTRTFCRVPTNSSRQGGNYRDEILVRRVLPSLM